MGLSPPSLSILRERIALKLHATYRGQEVYGDHGEYGNLRASVSAPETVEIVVAGQTVSVSRCRVIVRSNPTLTDPSGRSRKLAENDGVLWQALLWIVVGPMEVEATNSAGIPVAWRFLMGRTS